MLSVDCRPADGVVGETTEISCSFEKSFTDMNVTITAVTVTKRGATDPVFWMNSTLVQGDLRFDLPSREDPSLQLTNTTLSHEGLYDYLVVTNHSTISGTFRISVTASNSQTPNSTMAKITELLRDTRERTVDLHQAGESGSAVGSRLV
ncbi:hypothetical protein NFI96_008529 [Prochilodus magdalenae]|nr:hypothetical protein NFI96_008529 [Prochilodus magdalenae]